MWFKSGARDKKDKGDKGDREDKEDKEDKEDMGILDFGLDFLLCSPCDKIAPPAPSALFLAPSP